ncbi:Mitochondrial ribosome-associated GTPase 1 [Strongyloides ratti]|uniref:Mitochondrial GTPase 1 n=1 Tax=Strongyloides ratti TaxID=34506 RepID=A0A090N0C8_STRRB|nr:Mitochondrial ribosome-associated GTPase 1 [Strongyloides ratti]CEF70462.1 Mitochondrial ribosome-associated GTPase 1 [Strongyloides ratti]
MLKHVFGIRKLSDYVLPKIREQFVIPPGYDFKTWFPLHMSVQLSKMEGKLRSVDMIIEVHDARIPITGRNKEFYEKLYAVRPHMLVLNKMDLIDLKSYKEPIENYYREIGIKNIVWTDCKRKISKALADVKTMMLELLRNESRFNREVKTEYQVMVVGIPNVGKSSLINSLRSNTMGVKHNAVNEGARPGVTVRVQNRVRIMDKPRVYILDTPGVLNPKIKDIESSMKLGLSDYLLYFLNRTGDYSYVDLLKLKQPTDNINEVLFQICKSNNYIKEAYMGKEREKVWDIERAAKLFLNLYRTNKYFDHCLDKEILIDYKY